MIELGIKDIIDIVLVALSLFYVYKLMRISKICETKIHTTMKIITPAKILAELESRISLYT